MSLGRFQFDCRAAVCKAVLFVLVAMAFLAPLEQALAETILKRSTGREPRSLDPHLIFGSAGSEIAHDMFEGLLVLSLDGEPALGLAKSYAVSEDGLTYTFTLREGLSWSDGKPIRASDFVFSFRRLVDPKTASPLAGNAYIINNAKAVNRGDMAKEKLGVTAVDDLTLEITLEKPVPYFPRLIISSAFLPIPRHVVNEYGQSWSQSAHIVSNGAYKLSQWLPQQFISLERNESYHGAGDLKIDRVVYYPIENESQGLKRYRAGEIDILRNFPLSQLAWLQQNLGDDLVIHPSLHMALVYINLERALYQDGRVRKALSISIDRQIIIDMLLKDGSLPARNFVTPILEEYGPNDPPFASQTMEQRQAEARDLLAEAGYTADNPLTVGLKHANFERLRRLAIALQGLWRAVGIVTQLDGVGPQAATQSMFVGDFDMLLINHVPRHDDPMAALDILRPDSRLNYSRYRNLEFENLVQASLGLTDTAQRYEALRQAEQLAMADFPAITLYFRSQRWLVKPHVQGWTRILRGLNYTRNLSVVN